MDDTSAPLFVDVDPALADDYATTLRDYAPYVVNRLGIKPRGIRLDRL